MLTLRAVLLRQCTKLVGWCAMSSLRLRCTLVWQASRTRPLSCLRPRGALRNQTWVLRFPLHQHLHFCTSQCVRICTFVLVKQVNSARCELRLGRTGRQSKRGGSFTQFTCITNTKVQMLTQGRQCKRGGSLLLNYLLY